MFSVQDAIAAEGQRASEASTPGLDVPGQEHHQLSRLPSVPPAASLGGLQPQAPAPAPGAVSLSARSGLATRPLGARPSDRPLGLAGAPSPLAPNVLAQALGPKAPAGAAVAPLGLRGAGPAGGGLAAPVATASTSSLGLGTPRLGSPSPSSSLGAKNDGLKPLGLAAPAAKPLTTSNLGLGPRPTPLGKPGVAGTGLIGTGLIGARAPFGRGPVGETVTALVPEPVPKPDATSPVVADAGVKSESASSPPGPVLGRGSASAFPPVTAERTLPVVPPFHPAPAPSVSSVPPSPSAQSTPQRSGETNLSGAATHSTPPTDPGLTPRVPNSGTDDGRIPPSAGPWASNVNAPSAPPPGLDASAGVTAASDPTLTAKTKESPAVTPRDVGQTRDDLRFDPEYEFSATRKRPRTRVVSLALAAVVSVVFGAGGFASGYLIGVSKPAAQSAVSVTSGSESSATSGAPSSPSLRDSGLQGRGAAPPPPPPALELASSVTTELAAKPTEESKPKKSAERKTEEAALAGPESQPESGSNSNSNSSSLSGLGMALGPGPVPSAGSAGASSGAGLEAAAIQSTVQKNQNAVKRSCWQPALNGRAADAPSTARVTTTIQISPNGSVTSVKHSGDPRGYPGLGGCIVARLKGWTFPKSNGSTTANIPFVFAAQ